MSENQKRLLIIAVVTIIALILFMRNGGSSITNVSNSEGLPLNNIDSPTIVIEGRAPFILPDFGIGASSNELSAIGACCADCSARSSTPTYRANSGPQITFVTNQANRGPNVYNYFELASSQPVGFGIVRQRV